MPDIHIVNHHQRLFIYKLKIKIIHKDLHYHCRIRFPSKEEMHFWTKQRHIITKLLQNLLEFLVGKTGKAWEAFARNQGFLPTYAPLYSLITGLRDQFVCTINSLLSSSLYFLQPLCQLGLAILVLHLVQDVCKSSVENIFHQYDQQ